MADATVGQSERTPAWDRFFVGGLIEHAANKLQQELECCRRI